MASVSNAIIHYHVFSLVLVSNHVQYSSTYWDIQNTLAFSSTQPFDGHFPSLRMLAGGPRKRSQEIFEDSRSGIFTGRMPFPAPNNQCQCNQG